MSSFGELVRLALKCDTKITLEQSYLKLEGDTNYLHAVETMILDILDTNSKDPTEKKLAEYYKQHIGYCITEKPKPSQLLVTFENLHLDQTAYFMDLLGQKTARLYEINGMFYPA